MLQRLSIVYGVCVLKRKVVSNKMCTFCYHQRSTPEPSRCKGKGGDVCVCVCMHGRWAHVVLLAWRSGHVKPTPALCVCSCMGLVISVSQTLCQLPQTAHNLYMYMCMQLQCTGVPLTGCMVMGRADNTGQTGVALCVEEVVGPVTRLPQAGCPHAVGKH